MLSELSPWKIIHLTGVITVVAGVIVSFFNTFRDDAGHSQKKVVFLLFRLGMLLTLLSAVGLIYVVGLSHLEMFWLVKKLIVFALMGLFFVVAHKKFKFVAINARRSLFFSLIMALLGLYVSFTRS